MFSVICLRRSDDWQPRYLGEDAVLGTSQRIAEEHMQHCIDDGIWGVVKSEPGPDGEPYIEEFRRGWLPIDIKDRLYEHAVIYYVSEPQLNTEN